VIALVRSYWESVFGPANVTGAADARGWLASLILHVCVLVMLAVVWMQAPPREQTMVINAVEYAPIDPEQLNVEASDAPTEFGSAGEAGVTGAVALAPNLDQISESPRMTEPVEVIAPTISVNLSTEIPTAPSLDENLVIKGEAGESVSGASGAIDRITQEILHSIEQRPTLVVWVFDQSASLQPQREEIHARFDRVYKELGALEASGNEAFKQHEDAPLLTSVVSFGQDVAFLTPKPSNDLATIKSLVEGIQNDPTGVEHVFNAVKLTAERYRRYRQGPESQRRNVLIVIFTDECGDDQDIADATTVLCQRLQIPVYIVGVPAPFGREQILVRFRDPDPNFDQSERYLPVRQGPETVRPENVQLAFIGSSGRDDEFERLDSGFGPYALTRLCYETGGIYFSVHPNNSQVGGRGGRTAMMASTLAYFFDPNVMRSYRPEYVPFDKYNAKLMQNRACVSLVEAAELSQLEPMQNPRLFFPVQNEAQLKRDLDIAQRDAAILEPRLRQLHDVLKRGETDREKLTNLRWQAGYDLALGRVLAARARTEGYNAMLAKAEQGLTFEDKDSDTWVLRSADEITVGSNIEKMANQAKDLLNRVIEQHPDTPWALLAKRELRDPVGWKWTERHTGVNDPPPPQGNAPPPPPPPNQPPAPPPKPLRDIRL
jgi:hypothetical protein